MTSTPIITVGSHQLLEVDWPPGVVVCEDGPPRYLPGTGEVI